MTLRRFTLPAVVRLCLVALLGAGLLSLAPTTSGAASAQQVSAARRILIKREHHITDALKIAIRHEGAPYVYGAAGPNRFDCSGLTSFSYHRAGFPHVPRTAAEQARFARRIPRAKLRRGDLIFFTSGGHVYHVGLFDGRVHGVPFIIHAPKPGERVRRERIWTNAWFAGTIR